MIYFLRHPETGLMKIGTTTKYQKRLSDLMQKHGDLELLGLMYGNRSDEQQLHQQFSHLNEAGQLSGIEWFRADKELIAYIDKHAQMTLPLPTPSRERYGTVGIVSGKGRIITRFNELLVLKQERTAFNITLERIALETELAYATILRWSRGQITRYDEDTLIRLLEYFEVDTVSDLLGYEPNGKEDQ